MKRKYFTNDIIFVIYTEMALLDDLCALALIYFHAGSSIRPEFGENSGHLSNYITANKTQDKITKKINKSELGIPY